MVLGQEARTEGPCDKPLIRASGRDFPKIQILSVADLLAHSVKARFPAQDKASLLGYRAGKQEKAAAQGGLFGG